MSELEAEFKKLLELIHYNDQGLLQEFLNAEELVLKLLVL